MGKDTAKKTIDNDRVKTSKTERRRKFNKFKDTLHEMYGPITVFGGVGTSKHTKVMTNADRRELGVEEDPDLPDYQGLKSEEEKKEVKEG